MIKGDAIICTSDSAYNITIGKKYIIEEVGSLQSVLDRNKIKIIDDNDLYIRVHITYFKLVSVVRDEKLQALLDNNI